MFDYSGTHPVQSFFELLKAAHDGTSTQLSVEEFKTKVEERLSQFGINPDQFLSG